MKESPEVDHVGRVLAILNERYLLISSEEPLDIDDDLVVLGVVEHKSLDEFGLPRIVYPKGNVFIARKQENDTYLAETSRYHIETKTIYHDPFSLSGWSPLAKAERVEERVPESNPTPVDNSQSLRLKLPHQVQVGDLIARE